MQPDMQPAFEIPATTHKKYIWFTSWWLLDSYRLGLKVGLVFLKISTDGMQWVMAKPKKETMDSEASIQAYKCNYIDSLPPPLPADFSLKPIHNLQVPFGYE